MPENQIHVHDRGLAYGDGLFETLAIVQGECPAWPHHWQRLSSSAKRLGINLPPNLADELQHHFAEQHDNQHAPAMGKLMVTRGVDANTRGYAPSAQAQAQWYWQCHQWPQYPAAYYQQGVTVGWLQTTLACQPLLAGMKHLNRLEQVLAAKELAERQSASAGAVWQEGVCANQNGDIIGGTKSNLFIIQDQVLYTDPLTLSGIAGTMRAQVIAWAKKLGITVQIQPLTRYDVAHAEGWFLTNAVLGVWPIAQWYADDTMWQQRAVHPIVVELQQQLDHRLWPAAQKPSGNG